MREGFGDDWRVIRTSKIKNPLGGYYKVTDLIVPSSFASSHFSFLSSPPSLALWGASPCLSATCCHGAPVLRDIAWQSQRCSVEMGFSLGLRLSSSFITERGVLTHNSIGHFGWESVSTPPSKDGGFVLLWESCHQNKEKLQYCHKGILLGIPRRTSNFLHFDV